MVMRLFAATFVVLAASVLFAQSPAPPRLEIADVHTSPPSAERFARSYGLRDGRYQIENATMVDLIAAAYGVGADKVLGGPSWLEWDRFDIIAQAPAGATREMAGAMLQALLTERFQLLVHKDTKPVPAYALTLGKGKPKLNKTQGGGLAACRPGPPEPGSEFMGLACHNVSMDLFARSLQGLARDYLDAPVVNSTDLNGPWDFDLHWTQRGLLDRGAGSGLTIFDAVEQQLGLKLELENIPSSVIAVDSVKETPSPNAPGAAQALYVSKPMEFEVAEVRPSGPDSRNIGSIRNDTVDLEGWSLKRLIRLAWNITSDDRIANEPQWLDSGHFHVLAKVTTSGPPPRMNVDDLRVMLRALLAERFKLVTHMEDRLAPGYTLVADKPKLTQAEPANRTGCKEGRPPDSEGKDPREITSAHARLVTCRNITMTQFASQLPYIANGYIHDTVVDGTGLAGAWDFTLSFSAIGMYLNAVRVAPNGASGVQTAAAPTASDPSGVLSFFDAVKKLGLRLELQKRMMPVLVIDHVEPNPTEN